MEEIYENTNPIGVQELSPTGIRDLGNAYVNAFVTFIDVLGFKDIVKRADADEINTLLDAMQFFNSQPQRRRPPYNQQEYLPIAVQFSDSIVRIQPIPELNEDVDALDLLHGEITSLLIAQGNLACNGILVRGGLTLGKVCVNKNRIFGPAFNRAYYIESQLAKYPRIVIDESIFSDKPDDLTAKILGQFHWHGNVPHILEYLDRADDGLWGIDYLPHMFFAERSSGTSGENILEAHRDAIQHLLSDVLKISADDVLTKIRWAASYHNRTIERSFRKINDRYENESNSLILSLDGAV